MVGENLADAVEVVTDPLMSFGSSVVQVLPSIVGAVLLAVFGYLLATFVGILIKKALIKSGLETWYEGTGRHVALGNLSLSHLLAGMTKWYLFSLFFVPAASVVQLDAFASLLTQIALWVPRLLLGILLALTGIVAADTAADKMSHANKVGWVRALIPPVKFVIIIFFLDVALSQIGINFTLATSTFLILLTGITLAVSLAIGISLGFALRPEIEKAVKVLKRKFD